MASFFAYSAKRELMLAIGLQYSRTIDSAYMAIYKSTSSVTEKNFECALLEHINGK